MDKKSLRQYVKRYPILKQWLRTNGEWFASHPEAIRSMLENPAILSSFNDALSKKRNKLFRRAQKLEAKRTLSQSKAQTTRRKRRPLLKLPSLSSMNERLSKTSEMLDNIRSLMDNVK